MYRFITFLVILVLVSSIQAFAPKARRAHTSLSSLNNQSNDNNGDNNKPQGFMNKFMESVDKQIDDFFNKRMGNGEQFYGKRKYNPSGSVEGDYNGMGLTDQTRIEMARARKQAFLEEREEKRRAEAERRGLL